MVKLMVQLIVHSVHIHYNLYKIRQFLLIHLYKKHITRKKNKKLLVTLLCYFYVGKHSTYFIKTFTRLSHLRQH
jgi:hypothetical protein